MRLLEIHKRSHLVMRVALLALLTIAALAAATDPAAIRAVHVVQACHVDLGFGGSLADIIKYAIYTVILLD
jgi:hypothetical protein